MRSESGTSADGTSSRFHGNVENCVAAPSGGSGVVIPGVVSSSVGAGGGNGGGSKSGVGGGSHGNERINRFVDAASRFPPLGIDIPTPAGKKPISSAVFVLSIFLFDFFCNRPLIKFFPFVLF